MQIWRTIHVSDHLQRTVPSIVMIIKLPNFQEFSLDKNQRPDWTDFCRGELSLLLLFLANLFNLNDS